MSTPEHFSYSSPVAQRPWDARLARRLVMPLKDSWVTPNHLTTIRLGVGLAAAAAFLPGTYGWSNLAALLLILSNFLDHTDGELARISGKTSRIGHIYDLASDAAVTISLFIAIGIGVGDKPEMMSPFSPVALGVVAGCAIALIFYLRMRIEDRAGKAASRQASLGGFETEDVLYLLPLVTLSNAVVPFLIAAALCAPLFAVWVVMDYRRVLRRPASQQVAR
jgi:archaetidylinositol phosphate synthase